jgi:hypothetical protein
MDLWNIGISGWIIQDGNYPDFEVGQTAEFALEFIPRTITRLPAAERTARHLLRSEHQVLGEVVFCAKESWVLDFGLRAYRAQMPRPGIETGQFVSARGYLGVDPFFYIEELFQLPGMLPLVYTWQIEGITLSTAPYIQAPNRAGEMRWQLDESRRSSVPVPWTDAWHDNEGNAGYTLHCVKLNDEPRFRSSTAL